MKKVSRFQGAEGPSLKGWILDTLELCRGKRLVWSVKYMHLHKTDNNYQPKAVNDKRRSKGLAVNP